MTLYTYIKGLGACPEALNWLRRTGHTDPTSMLRDCKVVDWLVWLYDRVVPDAEMDLRRFACHVVRNTPLADGRTVWDLLTDERSRKAVEVAERYADGAATAEELDAARDAAWAAARDAARAAARAAARDAAWAAAWDAARDAAWAAARAAAWDAAWDAARDAAWAAAWDAARAAAWDAARAAARDAAWDAAKSWQLVAFNERLGGVLIARLEQQLATQPANA